MFIQKRLDPVIQLRGQDIVNIAHCADQGAAVSILFITDQRQSLLEGLLSNQWVWNNGLQRLIIQLQTAVPNGQ